MSVLFSPQVKIPKPPNNAIAAYRSGAKSLAPKLEDTFGLQAGQSDLFNSNLLKELQNFGTPEGLNQVANQNMQADLGAASDQAPELASQIAFSGGSAQQQDAAAGAAKQNALAHAQAFKNHLATPQGHQEILGYLDHLMNELGVDSPLYKTLHDIQAQIMQNKQVDASTQNQGPGILGDAAQIASIAGVFM